MGPSRPALLGYPVSYKHNETYFKICETAFNGVPKRLGKKLYLSFDQAHKALRWGKGVLGRADQTYPHPKGWTFKELLRETPL